MLQTPFFFCSSDSNAAADQKYIVAYPVALFYLTFSMLTMF
jgi:hypothetical protein